MAINVKREGTSHEARFKSEALKRGLDVLVPEGDYLPYDCMVVNGEGTKIRVQVKGTSYRAKGSKAHRLLAGCGKTKAALDPGQVAVLAAYVVPADVFYHIPIRRLEGARSLYLSPSFSDSRAKYEVWKDAWSVYENGGFHE